MTKTDFSSIRGILWDLDNTLYRASQEIHDAFNLAVAQAVIQYGLDMTIEEATAIASESWRQNRYSGLAFIERYNIPFSDLHLLTDHYMDHRIVARCEETVSLFARNSLNHALITHAARPWALNVLGHLGLKSHFPDHRVFAFENFDFESKARSRRSFDMALASLNLNPKEAVMVEDTIENLRVPHDMGLMTVFIDHGRISAEDLPSYVDHRCVNARDLLTKIHSSASG